MGFLAISFEIFRTSRFVYLYCKTINWTELIIIIIIKTIIIQLPTKQTILVALLLGYNSNSSWNPFLLWSLRPINRYLLVWLFCCLPQVVLAFHAGRLGASSSFMGKGVTYYSSLCLAHLTHEMAVIDPTQVSHCLSYYSLSEDYWDTLLSSCPPSPPPPNQCWCVRCGELTAITNIGRKRRRVRS